MVETLKGPTMITKPMLSGKFSDEELEDLGSVLTFPLLATPKYDGIRALMVGGKLLSRTFKNIPNKHIFKTCTEALPDGLDGELVSGTFNDTTGNVMRHDGEPEFEYHVFDYVKGDLKRPYEDRLKDLKALKLPKWCVLVLPVVLNNIKELEAYEKECLSEGFEGIMLRKASSAYKCGRGTAKALDLVKVKRFKDAEATIEGFEEEMKNNNEAEKDNFGRTKRSTSQENLEGKDTLGALVVRGVNGDFKGVDFKIGTGFDQALRKKIWGDRKKLQGAIVVYKYQKEGGEDRPRFPVFKGFRDKGDM
jgi:DNA ligase-1